MAEHDEYPHVVIVRRSSGVGAFLAGALIGAGVALLFAPKSGRETRDGIRSGALRIRDRAEDAVRNVTDSVQDTIGSVRGEVEGRIDAAREAFEAGRRAARETRRDMESRVQEVRAGVRGGVEAARRSGTATTTASDAPFVPAPADGASDIGL